MRKQDNPKILIYDLETSPNVVYSWRTGYKLTIGHDNIIEERQIICIAYKWSGEKQIKCLRWDPRKKHDKDKKMLSQFLDVLAEADAVVAHNGDNFDMKWIRGRVLFHGLPPTPVVKQIDTLKEVRRMFNLNSNRLDYVAKFLGNEGKSPMSFSDWKDVMAGSKKALDKMVKYCKQDVEELDRVFIKLRPYVTAPNIHQAVQQDRDACPSCGEHDNHKYGIFYTNASRFQKYKCNSCGHVWRDTRQMKRK